MITPEESRSGTYRCPVCGHSDSAELGPGEESRRIECSYCRSALEIRVTDPGSHGFSTRVAQASTPG